MSNGVSSSTLGLFHTINQKKLFEQFTSPSWGSHIGKTVSIGAPLCGARNQNILHSQHQNATNERHEILSDRSANADGPHHQVKPQPSYLARVNTAPLFLLIQLFLPRILFYFISILVLSSIRAAFSTNNLPLFSLSFPPTHIPPVFPFLYHSRTSSPRPPLSTVSLSLPCLLRCFATALTFPPVGLCVCCNELYLIANWDP